MKIFFILSLLVSSAMAQCPGATIQIGGSSTVDPLAKKWVETYKSQCPTTNLVLQEECGSSCGARRVCDQSDKGEEALDVGDMSRDWKQPAEASTTDGFNFQCANSNRRVIQIDVAIDGLSIAVATGGLAADCISKMGGMTIDQLRWIYSNLSEQQLISSGWDSSSIPNSDGDENTHLWSELNSECASTEILISGADVDSGTYDYFKEVVFERDTEDHPFAGRTTATGTLEYVNNKNDEILVQYLRDNEDAISYFGYAYAVQFSDILTKIPIQNSDGDFIKPEASSIESGEYNPFARRIYMNLWNTDRVTAAMKPFFVFAFSASGTAAVEEVGYVPIPQWERTIMLTRLGATGGVDISPINCGTTPGAFTIAGSSTVLPVARLWSEVYMMKCNNIDITYFGGGSSRGASRVCGQSSEFSAVEIGDMSRNWKESEATTTNGYEYSCAGSNRKAIQIEVAIDGLTVAVKRGSVAEGCVNKLGGLTIDQLRWMYSTFNDAQLRADGWDPNSVPNNDGDPSTHTWNEVLDDPACPVTEILISGADVFSGTYDYFKETVLPADDDGETFDTSRVNGYVNSEVDEVLVQYLVDNDAAISYFGYSYFAQNDQDIVAVPIRNSAGNFIAPTALSVLDGSYNPLARRIYMNMLDDSSVLALTRPFMDFGLSSVGEDLVSLTGYSPIPELERVVMRTRAQTQSGIPKGDIGPCGPSGGTITVAGSSTVEPVARLWGEIYSIGCDVDVQVEGGGSSIGADRVCGGGDGAVDIGNMSREWRGSEASEKNGNVFECLEHDTSRSAIQVDVAIDGLTVATNGGGAARQCIELLGGLNLDQLRWIYSSYTQAELEATGWDSSALGNNDGDDTTHFWSELNSGCPTSEILIAGADDLSGTQEYFLETVLTDHDNGEDFGRGRPNGYRNSAVDEDLVAYILQNDGAISYFGYAFYFQNRDSLFSAPIQNGAGVMVTPDETTVGNGSYEPLARRIFMNLYNDDASLENTVPFVSFGFTDAGGKLVAATGYVEIPEAEQGGFLELLPGGSGSTVSAESDGGSSGLSGGAIAGIVIGSLVGVALLVGAFIMIKKRSAAADEMQEEAHIDQEYATEDKEVA